MSIDKAIETASASVKMEGYAKTVEKFMTTREDIS